MLFVFLLPLMLVNKDYHYQKVSQPFFLLRVFRFLGFNIYFVQFLKSYP